MTIYTVYCDGYLIYDPRLDDYKITNAKLTRELNKADSFRFTIYPTHPNFNALVKLKSNIVVKQNNTVVFLGRILDQTLGWNNEISCVCEGAFAWLNDTIQRPFMFPVSESQATPTDYFAFLLGRHNEQEEANRQINIGTCTVTDPNNYIQRSDTQYSSTMQLLKEGLLDTLGGYFYMTYTESAATLHYYEDFNTLGNQPVTFGLNMLSLNTAKKGGDIATAVLPLGARDEETGERLTISSLADSTWDDVYKDGDIVYSSTAETLYGARIVKTQIWDDVTVASNLLTKAREYLAQVILAPQTVTITAADLSAAGYDYATFMLGAYVSVEDTAHSTAHGLASTYLVSKLTTDLFNPANNKLTLGATAFSLTEMQRQGLSDGLRTLEGDMTAETARKVRDLEIRTQSAITQSSDEILLQVTENTYSKGETDELIESVSSQIEQTAQAINLTFTNFQTEYDEALGEEAARFDTLVQYIRIEGASITLGKSNSEITLKIENDQIGIYRNGVLITYWNADRQITPEVLEIPVGGRLNLGAYAFIPRTNGSLDFSWIGA